MTHIDRKQRENKIRFLNTCETIFYASLFDTIKIHEIEMLANARNIPEIYVVCPVA